MADEVVHPYPNLSLPQKLFVLQNPVLKHLHDDARKALLDGIVADEMAPYYRALTSSPSSKSVLPLDAALLQTLEDKNAAELKRLDERLAEAEKIEGETEISDALRARADYLTRIGDKDLSIPAQSLALQKTPGLGSKIDVSLTLARLCFFFASSSQPSIPGVVFPVVLATKIDSSGSGNKEKRDKEKEKEKADKEKKEKDKKDGKESKTKAEVEAKIAETKEEKKVEAAAAVPAPPPPPTSPHALLALSLTHAEALIDSGGDWDRRNRLKVYTALRLLSIRQFAPAAELLLDAMSTFTASEVMSYEQFVGMAVLCGAVSLRRVDLKKRVIDAPEVNQVLPEMPILGDLVKNLYNCRYDKFFVALASLPLTHLLPSPFLAPHAKFYIREMRVLAYSQLLESYASLTLESMAAAFGVGIGFVDDDVSHFISTSRLAASIDKVHGIVRTTRPSLKNAQYELVVKQGDALLGEVARLGRGLV